MRALDRGARAAGLCRALTFAAAASLGITASVPGCAASNRAVETAKAAHYRGEPVALLGATRAAVAAKYEVATADETARRIETTARWYTPEGLSASAGGADDLRDIPDRSIQLKLIITLVPYGDDWSVSIEPIMRRYFTGRPNPDRLAPGDPSVPGWATGKVEQLYAAIHEGLKSYAVVTTTSTGPMDPDASAKQLLPR